LRRLKRKASTNCAYGAKGWPQPVVLPAGTTDFKICWMCFDAAVFPAGSCISSFSKATYRATSKNFAHRWVCSCSRASWPMRCARVMLQAVVVKLGGGCRGRGGDRRKRVNCSCQVDLLQPNRQSLPLVIREDC